MGGVGWGGVGWGGVGWGGVGWGGGGGGSGGGGGIVISCQGCQKVGHTVVEIEIHFALFRNPGASENTNHHGFKVVHHPQVAWTNSMGFPMGIKPMIQTSG